jgi:malate dehydrogenase (oxaloacetate-decarboxylating)
VSATPSAQYRLTIRVKLEDSLGILGKLTSAIGAAGGLVGAVDLVETDGAHSLRDIVVDASGKDHWTHILEAIAARSNRPTSIR